MFNTIQTKHRNPSQNVTGSSTNQTNSQTRPIINRSSNNYTNNINNNVDQIHTNNNIIPKQQTERNLFKTSKKSEDSSSSSDSCNNNLSSEIQVDDNMALVAFSNLPSSAKDQRLKDLAIHIKRLRRRCRNLENRIRFNTSNVLNKYLNSKINSSSNQPDKFNLDFEKIVKVVKRLKGSELKYSEDERSNFLDNLLNLIGNDKIKLNSLLFKKMATQLRMLLVPEKIKVLNEAVCVQFNKNEKIYVSKEEMESYKCYASDKKAMKIVLGVAREETADDLECIKVENIKAEQAVNKKPSNAMDPVGVNSNAMRDRLMQCSYPNYSQTMPAINVFCPQNFVNSSLPFHSFYLNGPFFTQNFFGVGNLNNFSSFLNNKTINKKDEY